MPVVRLATGSTSKSWANTGRGGKLGGRPAVVRGTTGMDGPVVRARAAIPTELMPAVAVLAASMPASLLMDPLAGVGLGTGRMPAL